MDERPLRFVVIGSGWRSLFYWRVAQAYPEFFSMEALLCRTQEKAEYMQKTFGVPAVVSAAECEAFRPELVVVAVSKPDIVRVSLEWAERGFPVLMETPAGTDTETLKLLWKRRQEGAKFFAAEQYFLYPRHAAAIAAVKHGYLGTPYAIDISAVHDYHAASLIRRYLSLHMEPVCVTAREYVFPVEETDSRYGPVTDGTVKLCRRVRASFDFTQEPGGEGAPVTKSAFYDFDSVQYHSAIRTRHLRVFGQRGELSDGVLRYVDTEHRPRTLTLAPETERAGGGILRVRIREDGAPDPGPFFYVNPFVHLGQTAVLPEDETAVGTLLLGVRRYFTEGTEVYPFSDALQDSYLAILMDEAAKTGKPVASERMPWM